MNLLANYKILREHKNFIKENIKDAKAMLAAGKLSKEDLELIIKAAPDAKYIGWMAKVLVNEKPNLDDLRNTVEEFHIFATKGKTSVKDIYAFKKFKDLKKEVDNINNSGESLSNKELESDYETIVDDKDMLIMVPHTHEASRKLGLSKFAFRDCREGGKDSAWCTTYKAPDHFDNYYYANNVTFYYIRVKSEDIISQLKKAFPGNWKNMVVVALAVLKNNRIDGYDGLDTQMTKKEIAVYMKILNLTV